MQQGSLFRYSKRVLLIILDGMGINPKSRKNALRDSAPPHLMDLMQHYPFTTLQASGEAVGLAKGIAGNSEVGHINLGSGRAVTQDLVRINRALDEGSFASMPRLQELIQTAKAGSKRIHLMGLISDGGVHAHLRHIKEVIKILAKEQDCRVYLHCFMDGRDTPVNNGRIYLQEIPQEKNFLLASMQGRSIGMDRDQRWEKIQRAYEMMTGKGALQEGGSPSQYLESEYAAGRSDEFITPMLFSRDCAIRSEDVVFFLNFRPDRARELTLAFSDPNFNHFATPVRPKYFLCMSPYVDDEVKLPILFDKEKVRGGLAEYLSAHSLKQFKIAETEKYAHVTYFFNGGEEKPFSGEERKLIPSPRDVSTYDLKPEMSAFKVTEELLKVLQDPSWTFMLVNFANPDMVGHTGNYEAAKNALKAVDECVGKLMQKCAETNTLLMLTSDHGNCDEMELESGEKHTSHTGAPVPFVVYAPELKGKKLNLNSELGEGALKDVAPTVLYALGLEVPREFEGKNIFE